MSNTQTKSVFVKAPVDGVNFTSSPIDYKPTEARELINYYCYDWGIRERGVETLMFSTASGIEQLYPFWTQGGVEKIIFIGTNNTVYLMASTSDTSPTNITGAVTVNAASVNICNFNKNIFFFCEGQTPWKYDIVAGGNCAATSFSGPTVSKLAYGWNFKNRLYALEGTTGTPTLLWYGGVGSTSGTMTSFDLAQVLERPGYIITGFSWGYNQGLNSDELMVLISNSGEILFYSGDWPAASNWQLVARASIPKPTGRNCIVKFGQEVFISTSRGVIQLSQIFAGRTEEDVTYYSASRNVGTNGVFLDRQFSLDPQNPFLYGCSSTHFIYTMNYERGAWSALRVTPYPTCICNAGGFLFYGTNSAQGALGLTGLYRIEVSGAGENTGLAASMLSWKTPFYDFGSNNRKQSSMVRMIGQDLNTSNNKLITMAKVGVDFVEPTSSVYSSNSTTTTAGLYSVAEVAPGGQGRRLSYCFMKTPTGERNELTGFEATYVEGELR